MCGWETLNQQWKIEVERVCSLTGKTDKTERERETARYGREKDNITHQRSNMLLTDWLSSSFCVYTGEE